MFKEYKDPDERFVHFNTMGRPWRAVIKRRVGDKDIFETCRSRGKDYTFESYDDALSFLNKWYHGAFPISCTPMIMGEIIQKKILTTSYEYE